ncbi:uracil-DNA glycosylase [Salirhabdus euzebyi]|uniref:Uracil-DNA glycosylase n=1 Tax=Salirhabdus euzebyi TaxID=394506 RepID=A0A841Q321_9BACI|nr:uracil-DNA glycosylase [Salirhabdus euzebyi]MBB6452288.1 uracil-DNA glycosylase [Salirhabdus euzebyi]
MFKKLPADWAPYIQEELTKPYFLNLEQFLMEEYTHYRVHPKKEDIFNVFDYTPFQKVKVVILGQDPYHGPNQAHGLSFSVQPNVSVPPSLRNIFKELESDLGYKAPQHGHLLKWADQGVLLLNTVLTVRENEANSHRNQGWEMFTDKILEVINDKKEHVVFVLWGNHAIQKAKKISREKHYVLKGPHPSPLSSYRGFFGSKPFSKVNSYLKSVGKEEINWQL